MTSTQPSAAGPPVPPWRSGSGSSRMPAALGAAAIAVVLWNVPLVGVVLFPLRLLTTFAHEASHGTAALVTGGTFDGFEIALDGSGLATTSGGWRWLILPAGYVGSAITAAGLFVAAHRAPRPQTVALVVGLLTAVVAILFGLSSMLALLAGLGSAAGFVALSRLHEQDTLVVLVLNLVAFVTAWNAVLDLLNVLRRPSIGTAAVLNDAAAFGEHVGIGGGRTWAAIWLLVVLAVLAAAARLALRGSPEDDTRDG